LCILAGRIDTNNGNLPQHAISFKITPDLDNQTSLAAADLEVKFALCVVGLIIGGQDSIQPAEKTRGIFFKSVEVVRKVPLMYVIYLATAFKVKISELLTRSRSSCNVHGGVRA
jgi:hypothetical protein